MTVLSTRPVRDRRPSPDALLRAAGEDGRGRLMIFLGAAPGVGKTYEMLTSAHARAREGVDVVIGVVETHGRAETEALTQGLETIPRLTIDWNGHTLHEMDLDAILARRPRLVLVDELAHTNAHGCRHPKRFMDVEELLAAGIDVYTTLNIQHVESLNDVVARITRIRVRETVPDSVLDRADDIELIDLTPRDLIQRLRDGKVYVPKQAERAIRHYFQPGNLTALRELALRQTARRVDEQMVDYMRGHAIQGPWPAGERVLVCIEAGRRATAVVRHARRLADQLHAPWTAINVETAAASRAGPEARDSIAEAMRLAEDLGAETVVIPAQNVADTIIEHARANNITHIIVGKSGRGHWRDLFARSVTRQVIDRAGGINIHVIEAPSNETGTGAGVLTAVEKPLPEPTDPRPYAFSLLIVAAAIPVGLALQHFLNSANVTSVFLTAILFTAVLFGRGPSLFASLAAVLAYNFFFLPPVYSFTISDPDNVVALFFFAVVALIAGNLTVRVRSQALAARLRARTTDDLYQFSRKLAVAVTLDDLLWATAHQIALMLKMRVVLLMPEDRPATDDRPSPPRTDAAITVRAGFPPEDTLDDADLAAAKWCWEKDHATGRGSDTLPGARWLFLPLRTGRGPLAVAGVTRDEDGPFLSPDQFRLLGALTDQAALAIERVTLARDLHQARLRAETDQLRAALLTSISHDLRTPLASILGSATSLASSQGEALDAATRQTLLETIVEEADRLNRFIGNLLDMTRLESGALRPRTSLTDLSDVLGAALSRAARILAHHQVDLDLAADLPLVRLDVVLFEQVLFNLFDNAAKYAPPGSLIRVTAEREDGQVMIRVIDEGPGIPPADVDRIFDKFFRARGTDRQRAGTGLGLAICRGFVEAMGGRIMAANRTGRSGAVIMIALPVPTGEPMTATISEDTLS
jgi:two-component system sensor histidine kinase KdpD